MSESTKDEMLQYLDGMMKLVDGKCGENNWYFPNDGTFKDILRIVETWPGSVKREDIVEFTNDHCPAWAMMELRTMSRMIAAYIQDKLHIPVVD